GAERGLAGWVRRVMVVHGRVGVRGAGDDRLGGPRRRGSRGSILGGFLRGRGFLRRRRLFASLPWHQLIGGGWHAPAAAAATVAATPATVAAATATAITPAPVAGATAAAT